MLCLRSRSKESFGSQPSQQNDWSWRFRKVKGQLRIPIKKPEVYKPLILILTCTCLQHFSGFTFTKKFLVQILSHRGKGGHRHGALSDVVTQEQGESTYYFAIVISFLRLSANLLMSYLSKRFRVRLLYFVSVFTTSGSLVLLGVLQHPTAIQDQQLSPENKKLLRLLSLSIHVFAVQIGLQTIAGLLTDCLLPADSKRMLKGICRSFQSLSLFIFVSLMELLPEPWQFWSMAVVLLLSSPALYICLPELWNLGKYAGELYFQSPQPIFYEVVPKQDQGWPSELNARRGAAEEESLRRRRELNEKNQLAVIFVQNILSTNSWLSKHQNSDRVIVARGPARITNGKSLGVFLFCDVVIIAKKLMNNRRYVSPAVVEIDRTFSVVRKDTTVIFRNLATSCEVVFKTIEESTCWERSANFSQKRNSSSFFVSPWSGVCR